MQVISSFLIFTFTILMPLDSELIPVKRKINILICLPLQQLERSKVEKSQEENILLFNTYILNMNMDSSLPPKVCLRLPICCIVKSWQETHQQLFSKYAPKGGTTDDLTSLQIFLLCQSEGF